MGLFVCKLLLACSIPSFLPSLSRGDNPQPKMMMVIEVCKLKVLWVEFSNLHGLQLLPEDGKLMLLLIPYFSADLMLLPSSADNKTIRASTGTAINQFRKACDLLRKQRRNPIAPQGAR
jgi:hypothetical protein